MDTLPLPFRHFYEPLYWYTLQHLVAVWTWQGCKLDSLDSKEQLKYANGKNRRLRRAKAMDRMIGSSDVPRGMETEGTSDDIAENCLPVYLNSYVFVNQFRFRFE